MSDESSLAATTAGGTTSRSAPRRPLLQYHGACAGASSGFFSSSHSALHPQNADVGSSNRANSSNPHYTPATVRHTSGAEPSTSQQNAPPHDGRDPLLLLDLNYSATTNTAPSTTSNAWPSGCYISDDIVIPDEDDLNFWSFANCHSWANAPSIVEANRRRKLRERASDKMADPFEVRMRFSSQLQHLNASAVAQQKAAQYALKYGGMSEDLHSCILEQLEKNSMNTRANIMYFIVPFLEMAEQERNQDYIRRMQRDILRVVDAVCPEDGSGVANIKVVRKVLQGLNEKGFLLDQTVVEIEECLKDRAAVSHADLGMSSPVAGEGGADSKGSAEAVPSSSSGAKGDASTGAGASAGSGQHQNQQQQQHHHQSQQQKTSRPGQVLPPKVEKRQMEQRIEEDRERHKKRRESMWVVPKDEEEKRMKLWDDVSDLGEDDFRLGQEESEELDELLGIETRRNGKVENGVPSRG
ncbi:CTD kinase subunit gamma CTK3-domain-containing protein [Xylariales sp. PMI_506]|nr:CTD kinase subunit gamma CTK3-domain-containing protein [Xylariales sp. PMI_506]